MITQFVESVSESLTLLISETKEHSTNASDCLGW